MRFRTEIATALLLMATAAGVAAGQQPADTVRLTLDEAVRRSLELGEEVRSARAQVQDARGQIREATAAALPVAWGRRIRYEKLSDDSFRLRSAGPDGAFDTGDDIVKDF